MPIINDAVPHRQLLTVFFRPIGVKVALPEQGYTRSYSMCTSIVYPLSCHENNPIQRQYADGVFPQGPQPFDVKGLPRKRRSIMCTTFGEKPSVHGTRLTFGRRRIKIIFIYLLHKYIYFAGAAPLRREGPLRHARVQGPRQRRALVLLTP